MTDFYEDAMRRGLPEFLPRKTWEPAPAEYTPVTWGGAYPPIKKLSDGRLVIDQTRRVDGGHDVAVFDNKDHPNISLLPANAPRAIKALYRRENQLMLMRSTDGMSGIKLMDAAMAAVEAMVKAKGRHDQSDKRSSPHRA